MRPAVRGSISLRFAGRAAAAWLLLAITIGGAAAGDFRTPGISIVRVEWRTVLDQLKSEIEDRPAIAGRFTFNALRHLPPTDPRTMPALMQLNAVTLPLFERINQSPVPVLLPFDTGMYLAERMTNASPRPPLAHFQDGFQERMFNAGPAGYDAKFALAPGAAGGMPQLTYKRPVEVQITGSILTYDIDDPSGGKGEPVSALAAQFPDLRRIIREGDVRYAFTRFGVPYVVSIHCLDSAPRANRLACREASVVAERFLKALRIAGGRPLQSRMPIAPGVMPRPETFSPDFTYRPPGDIIANSGYRGESGHADTTVYSQIRFPIERAPAYANSQSFLNWGDCFYRGRVPPPSDKGDHYHCKSSNKPLVFDESAPENYSYPWQDNFCEARDFNVGQCPAGFGHQGQDLRPATCTLRNKRADRCIPNRYAVVAVRDGVIIRSPKHQSVTLLVNTRNEHLRFRYMHMNPAQLDKSGMLDDRRVSEGEKIGLISNYMDHPGGTTTHLHFDVQVFTRDGWIWVNPYVTLISAYERLIGERGREIATEAEAGPPPAKPQDPVHPEKPAEGEDD
ncbi:M23 family peptidase [Nitrobacter sp.]|uniref:M23 family peptidase n=1 Tax=Nitrobacter sp. TaxID=29420 RepID=UPI003F64C93E